MFTKTRAPALVDQLRISEIPYFSAIINTQVPPRKTKMKRAWTQQQASKLASKPYLFLGWLGVSKQS